MRILVVDDSTSSRRLIIDLLGPLKAEFSEAENGRIALDTVESTHFDAVVTDIDMPAMDGVELCKRIKENTALRDIPIIMVSKFDSDKTINRGFEAGASEYVPKHLVRSQLLERVQHILSESSFYHKQRILVVDDSYTTLKLIAGRLSRYGFKVETARNGKEAFEILDSKKINLVLSDVFMPVMDGMEFLHAFKQTEYHRHIPVITMSTNNDRRSIRKMRAMGSAAYLIKPFNIDSLVVLIEKLLSDQYLFLLHEKEQLEQEQQTLVDNITSLITALEARDLYTKGHSENVAHIASEMVKINGGSEQEVEEIKRGALLHDIGKIGVPDSILNKPGRLNDEEYAEIKKHPEIGYRILMPISRLDNAQGIVRYHHERFDGKGYPSGLAGTDIPKWARIVAVADTYDALSNERPYKRAFTPEEAGTVIKEVSGSQLCPESVELFFEYMKNVGVTEKETLYEHK
jgi:putative two-component system response regulator